LAFLVFFNTGSLPLGGILPVKIKIATLILFRDCIPFNNIPAKFHPDQSTYGRMAAEESVLN